MNSRRVEVTFSVAQWEDLERARGRESRASFCRRAVVEALAVPKRVPLESPPLAPESVRDEAAEFLGAEQPKSTEKELRGLKNSAEAMWPDKPKKKSVKDLMWERQQRLNKGKP